MPNFLINLLAFIVAISFLVAFHEWGHYIVARRLGVKVLRFSIGFGKPIWTKISNSGVEFCISAIPLGGYVKMLDEREGFVADNELHLAFNRQNVWKRIAIVIAGPLANFLLAVILFVAVLISGVTGYAPFVTAVTPDSPASTASVQVGDEIVAVNDIPVRSMMGLSRAVAQFLDETHVDFKLLRQNIPYNATLDMPSLDSPDVNPLESMGITVGLPALIGSVLPGESAEKAGIQPGDRIVSIDEEPITDWMDAVTYVSEHPNATLDMRVDRKGQLLNIPVFAEVHGAGQGHIGVALDQSLIRKEKFTFVQAVPKAVTQTYDYAAITLKMIFKMITGKASLEHLSGPITIAQVAGATAKVGVTYYLDFLAIISISLGVLNLLPVPVLDGGHLLYYLIEVIKGKPLTETSQNIGLRLGLIILVSLMILAFYNDILRLV